MSNPGQLANLYFPPRDMWIAETVEKMAAIEGVSTTEMYLRLLETAINHLKADYPEKLKPVE